MTRAVAAVSCAAFVLAMGLGAPSRRPGGWRASARPAAVVVYSAPVASPVRIVRAFDAPLGPYAAGHRGVDLSTSPGATVLAAAVGVVRFAGMLAGRGVVVIEHPDGVLTEYESLTPAVSAGWRVARGQPIGQVRGRHGSCAPNRCLHWGARRRGSYLDPMTLLAGLGPVRLLPWAS